MDPVIQQNIETPWNGVLVGVLGGMGPDATASFIHDLTAATPAAKDQDHIPSVTLCLPGIPDRTTALLHGGESPAPVIRQGLRQLADWGATMLAIPCNTAHIFIDKMSPEELPDIPLVHIIQAVMDQAQEVAPGGAWLTGTEGTLRSGIYQREAEKRGYEFRLPDERTQELSNKAIAEVKAGRLDEAGAVYRDLADHVWSTEDIPVVTACTELPLAYEHSGLPMDRQVSSLGALAWATVKEAQRQRDARA